jgi:hypothetical protein
MTTTSSGTTTTTITKTKKTEDNIGGTFRSFIYSQYILISKPNKHENIL